MLNIVKDPEGNRVLNLVVCKHLFRRTKDGLLAESFKCLLERCSQWTQACLCLYLSFII